jgi:hypothetical protein
MVRGKAPQRHGFGVLAVICRFWCPAGSIAHDGRSERVQIAWTHS